MRNFTGIAIALATSCLAVATPAIAQTAQDDARFQQAQQRFDNELRVFRQEFDRYQAARANNPRGGYRGGYDDQRRDNGYNDSRDYNDDRVESGYDPARYYRSGPNYQERVLSSDERVYRGNDGRYYCRRSDGTTGLIAGAALGGLLGNALSSGRSATFGTLLGVAGGAALGSSIDRGRVVCR